MANALSFAVLTGHCYSAVTPLSLLYKQRQT